MFLLIARDKSAVITVQFMDVRKSIQREIAPDSVFMFAVSLSIFFFLGIFWKIRLNQSAIACVDVGKYFVLPEVTLLPWHVDHFLVKFVTRAFHTGCFMCRKELCITDLQWKLIRQILYLQTFSRKVFS